MAVSFVKKGAARTILWIVAGLTGAVLLFFGWRGISGMVHGSGDPSLGVPPGALVVAEWSDPGEFINERLAGNQLWQGLISDNGWAGAYRLMTVADSVLGRELPPRDRKSGVRTLLAILRASAGTYQPLLLMSVPGGGKASMQAILERSGERKGKGREHYYEIPVTPGGEKIYACIREGILAASLDLGVMETSAKLLGSRGAQDLNGLPAGFSKWAGHKADLHAYLPFKQLGRFMSSKLKNPAFDITRMVSSFAGDMELDFMVRDKDITANGFTNAPEGVEFSLSCFKGQAAPTIRVAEVLPYQTQGFINFGITDFPAWYRKWNPGSKTSPESDQWLSWVAGEAGIALVTVGGNSSAKVACLRVGDHEKALRNLFELSGRFASGAIDTTTYRNYLVGKSVGSEPLSVRFGYLWEGFSNPWYTIVDDYVLISNDKQVLTEIINQYIAGNTLAKSDTYQDFSQNVSSSSNIYLYADLGRMPDLVREWVDTSVAARASNFFAQTGSGIIGLQWEWDSDDAYFTNIYYSSEEAGLKARTVSGWQTTLQARVAKGPYLVFDHREGNHKILVFDEANRLYMIDAAGTIRWQAQISEAPLSGINEVDIYRNNKIQYLFNTRDKVYLIDLNGELVPGFPWSLPVAASGPVAVFDYENNRDYRLMVPCTDRRIYDFQIDGRKVKGWAPSQSGHTVSGPVIHARLNTKDIIVYSDDKGKVTILNRRGEERIDAKQAVTAAANVSFFVDRSKARHRLLFTDTAGRITEISQGGDVTFTKVGDFGPDHRYLYGDFTGDGKAEHIISDADRIYIFDDDYRLIRTDTIGFIPDGGIRLATVEGYGPCLLAGSANTGQIILLNQSGVIRRFDAIRGTLPPLVVRLQKDGPQVLVTGEGQAVYQYPLEQE